MTQKEESEQFYPLKPSISQKLRKAKLTAAEWRFWAYLTEIDPWGDRYKDISPLTIMAECEMSKPTYYRAKAKFQELGLFDFQEEKVSFRNLTGVSKMKQQSQKFNGSLKNETVSLKNETENSKMRQVSQKRETEAPESSPSKDFSTPQTIQTYSNFKTNQTLLEAERERNLSFWVSLNEEEQSELIAIAGSSFLPKLEVQPTLPLKWIQCNCLEIAKFSGIDKYSGNPLDRENLWGKKEWEAEPGVPYPALEEERIGYWVHKGEPIETATAKARAELRNPVVAKDLWEGFLRRCDRLADDAIKAKSRGVETPYLPPSFTEKSPITKESVSAKLGAIAPQFCLESSADAESEESEIETIDDSPPTAEALNKSCITDAGRKFVESLIAKNPQWNYEMVRGQVVAKDGVW